MLLSSLPRSCLSRSCLVARCVSPAASLLAALQPRQVTASALRQPARIQFGQARLHSTAASLPRVAGGYTIESTKIPAAPVSGTQSNTKAREQPGKRVGYWLLGTAGLVYGIVVLGGLTRLTESGLSITEWKPVTGALPPLNADDWQREFDLYKQSPEFKILNAHLTLEEFKFIYWMEWSHRQLGRAIGLVFAVPAVYMIVAKRYPLNFKLRLGGIAALIGFQGFIGWWMVASGLEKDLKTPRVSQYRLAAHLGTAFLVYLSMLHNGLNVVWPANAKLALNESKMLSKLPRLRHFTIALGILTYLTAMSGAFVAGLDAGLIYNDFPYMGNSYIPPTGELVIGLPSLNAESSTAARIIHNMFENPVLAQLDHRILAVSTATLTWGLAGWIMLQRSRGLLPKVATRGGAALSALILMQATLGITTLWYLVPTPLAATHQAGSLAVLTGIIIFYARLRRIPPSFMRVARVGTRS
ncbi:Cytochrome c oxidase assembly protein cox15 [Savitreella phatthalungensis]